MLHIGERKDYALIRSVAVQTASPPLSSNIFIKMPKKEGIPILKVSTGNLQEKDGKWYAVVNCYEPVPPDQKLVYHVCRFSTHYNVTKVNRAKAKQLMEEVILPEPGYETNPEKRQQKEQQKRLFLEYLNTWVEGKWPSVAPLTYESYRKQIDGKITAYFGPQKLRLCDVTAETLSSFYSWMVKTWQVKGSTLVHYHAVFTGAFKLAKQRKLIAENPCDTLTRPLKEQYVPDYYSAGQARQLLQEARNDEIYIPVVLSVFYGLRRSEVIGLRWKSVDFQSKKIVINHKIIECKNQVTDWQMGKNNYLLPQDTMKTSSSYRTLPLLPAVERFLLELKEQQAAYRRLFGSCYDERFQDYICLFKDGQLISPRYVTAHFHILLEKVGLPRIRFHDLRHSCASMLIQEDVQMKNIQLWLGHSDISTTVNIYSHLEYKAKLQSAGKMEQLLGGYDEAAPGVYGKR